MIGRESLFKTFWAAMSGPATSGHPTSFPRFAAIPASSWAFALRTWIATVLALYVAFWLQLRNAYSAAVCVAILALPTRGQALGKAMYRSGGTVVGVIAGLAIAAFFSELRDLFLVAFAAWMAICGYAASFLDGDRAYGAVLSGFTAAIVAFINIDTPQNTFAVGLDRCAVILVGVLAVTIVNDVLAAPNVLPRLLEELGVAHRRIIALAERTSVERKMNSVEFDNLLKSIVGFRLEIAVLPVESIVGRCRVAAARTAVAAMARQLVAMRIVGSVLQECEASGRGELHRLADAFGHALRCSELERPAGCGMAESSCLVLVNAMDQFLCQASRAASAIEDMRSGRRRQAGSQLQRFFLFEVARRNALRLFIVMLGGSTLMIYSGWPAISNAIVMLAAIAAISVTVPNPQVFAKNALIAMVLSVTLAGLTQFVIWDGADSLPALALGLAPAIVGASLLAIGGHPTLSPVGTLTLIFMPLVALVSNPPNYDPRIFLISATQNLASVIFLLLAVNVVLPTGDDKRRLWIKRSLHRDFASALTGQHPALDVDASTFRDLDREAQLKTLASPAKAGSSTSPATARWIEFASAARSVRLALADLDPDTEMEGRSALAELDPARLAALASQPRLQGTGADQARAKYRAAAAALIWMARLIERHPADALSLSRGA
jgi:uncharacterized membrane protein YccC